MPYIDETLDPKLDRSHRNHARPHLRVSEREAVLWFGNTECEVGCPSSFRETRVYLEQNIATSEDQLTLKKETPGLSL